MAQNMFVLFIKNLQVRLLILGLVGMTVFGAALFSAPSLRRPATASAMFATITVTTTADTVAADGQCSLREAIQAANTNTAVNECAAGAAGLDTIQFNIGVGTPTINVTSALPAVSEPVIINGNTGGATRVELNGLGAGAGVTGLTITAGGSTVQALVINRFTANGISLATGGGNAVRGCIIGLNSAGTTDQGNTLIGISVSSTGNTIGGTGASDGNVISGNNSFGISLTGASNTVQGNIIGLNAAGAAAIANTSGGIEINNAASNVIGGTTAAARNIISGNGGAGVNITGATATTNLVQGNYIGTNPAGTAALGNSTGLSIGGTNNTAGGTAAGEGNLISGNNTGVAVGGPGNLVQGNLIGTEVTGTAALGNGSIGVSATGDATIGGTTAAARNIISGNGTGVGVSGTNNTIQGNYIGTDINGTADLGNTGTGVSISGNSNFLGGTAAGAGNLISGNNSVGITVSGASNQVQGNLIGTNAAGTAALGNSDIGVYLPGSNNTIGGTAAAARNVIAASGAQGIFIEGNTNTIQGNFIGTDMTGTVNLGSVSDGIRLTFGAQDNLIGGTVAGAGNLIAFSGQRGVNLSFSSTAQNRILGNSIHSNSDIGIDLGSNGVTANDLGDADGGPNSLQNFPALVSVNSGVGTTTVAAGLSSAAATLYRIEFFSNPSCDVSGNGEGQAFLGTVDVTTDVNGNTPINAVLPGNLAPGHVVAMTATDPAGNTSEFSSCATCSYGLSPGAQPFQVPGGSNSFNIASQIGCPWTATSNDPWITINSGASGFGSGSVSYTVAANAGASARVGSIMVAGQTFFVSQAATGELISTDFSGGIPAGWVVVHGGTGFYPGGQPAAWTTDNPCNRVIPSPFVPPFALVDSQCAIQPATQDESLVTPPFDATGQGQVVLRFDNQFRWFSGGDNEIGDVDVTTDDGQTWINVLRFEGGDEGFPTPTAQNLNLTPFIAGNPSNVRVRFHYYVTAAPRLAGRAAPKKPNVPAFQELSWGIDRPVIASFTIGPTNQTIGQNGGTGQVAVQVAPGVPWMAESHVPWIQLLANEGAGSGSVGYEVMPNLTGAPRAGTATIANNTFTILQDGMCLTITVNPAALPDGTAGTPYQQTLTVSGGLGPYVYTVSGGSLPNGLTLSENGQLAGTPTAFGTFNFTASVTDASNCTGTKSYTLTINQGCAVTVNPSGLPVGTVGTVYSQTLTGSGGTAPYSFAVSAGTLPGGLNLSSGGALTGTPNATGSFTFTVRATDASASACTGERQYTLTINPAGNGLQFYPLPAPVRLLDTRSGVTGCVTNVGTLAANSTRTQLARTACSTIPANATAIIGSITVVPSDPGYLTLFPSDATQPTVANSNFNAGEVTNNFFTVGLGASGADAGAFKIFTSATTHVIIDLTGYYAPPAAGGLYYHPLPAPVRLVQTFPGQTGCFANPTVTQLQGTNDPNANPSLDLVVDGRGAGLPSPCNSIPGDAVVLVGNATTVFPNAPFGFGYLTIYPSDATRPTVASSNYGNNDIINGPFAVKLGADGKFKVYTFSTTHLVIDISGYYSSSASDANGVGLLFNPLPKPMRLLETRNIPGFPLTGCYQPQAPIAGGTGGIRTQQVWGTCSDQPITIPNTSRAIVGNVTAINPVNAGFGTFFPGNVATAPTVATTNYPFPVVFGYNRHYYVGLSPADGTFKILTQFTSDYIVDVSGYFAP